MTITAEPTTTTATTTTTNLTVKLGALRDMLNAHLLTVGRDELLPVFTMIRLRLEGETLTAESTDRYRATRTMLPGDVPSGPGDDFMLTTPHAKQILTVLPKPARFGTGDYVQLSIDEGILTVQAWDPDLPTLTYRTADASWPKLSHIIDGFQPDATENIGVNPAFMVALCKMPRERNQPVRLDFNGRQRPMRSTWECNGVVYVHVIMSMRFAD